MNKTHYLILSLLLFALSISAQIELNTDGNTIETRIPVPDNCIRTSTNYHFTKYLRSLDLKPHNSLVEFYNGGTKFDQHIYCAVLDQDIGNNDLHQCADAVIRLKADYHYERGEHELIAFNFTNGHRVAYSKWKKGNRIAIEGNKTWWTKTAEVNDSYSIYWAYLEQIFMYAGTYSLDKELKSIDISKLKPGDVFIKGGFPGHAVMVVDIAQDTVANKKYYLLGQSYMPAQQFHILNSYYNTEISPWYELKEGDISTPEWTFSDDQLKRWR